MSAQTLPAAALAEIEAAGLTPEQLDILRKVWVFAYGTGFAGGRKVASRKAFELGAADADEAGPRHPLDERSRYSRA